MMRKRNEAVVGLCIGDFKKNVIMRGTSSSGRIYYEGNHDTELEDYRGIIHCTLKFSLDEDDYNYLIDKYYPERTHPSTESQKEKYGDLEVAIDGWNEFLEMKKRYYKSEERPINDKQMQVKEVAVIVDGIAFVVYFMEVGITNDSFKLHFYATDESVQKNFISIFNKMRRYSGEIDVEMCIGDFKKNVIVRGTSCYGRLYGEEIGMERENYTEIVHCTLKFSLDEEDCNYLIDK